MLFDNTKRISIELSNLCNLSKVHKSCPLSLVTQKEILPLHIIKDIIETCKKYSFKGFIAFHTYNEPLIDPRLFYLINKFVEIETKPIICTNGYYLNENLIRELYDVGIVKIHISCYTKEDYDYFRSIKYPKDLITEVNRIIFDNRLSYEKKPDSFIEKPGIYPLTRVCFAPLQEILIKSNGNVGLCCYDWRRDVSFGNLYDNNFESILNSDKITEAYKNLSKGDRFFWICHNCKTGR